MKKTLVLVRHATAEDQTFRIKDFDRNLNSKGLSEAAAMGKWLAESGVKPDIFITSPASRAYKTAEIISGKLGVNASSLITNADIYEGGPQSYLNAVNTVPENFSMLMLFGHNPDISYFAEYLTGSNLGSMKKGSIAIIDFDDLNWAEISAKTGNLNLYKTPGEVREAE
ncbi:phosphohistidine phosphatase [Dyadobacter flavalbus]|uniref:Phosphohistidine phosphatase n=1 Tax=Dyadobacter flavalbus TaxID=2579942 RepID=A0A5M8R004_9BACT|nr:histidine phosphatase family protein [Dyadobacter flavalbus]KAA6439983.1 phosphohistidine phosphatase [Dyadobacter flavalbus]